jgi:hypothetical protein
MERHAPRGVVRDDPLERSQRFGRFSQAVTPTMPPYYPGTAIWPISKVRSNDERKSEAFTGRPFE